jgi:hypothetical protein
LKTSLKRELFYMVDPLIIREMTGKREEFFRLYSSLQAKADASASVDDEISEALAAARFIRLDEGSGW